MADIEINAEDTLEVTEYPFVSETEQSTYSEGSVAVENGSDIVTGYRTVLDDPEGTVTFDSLFQLYQAAEHYTVDSIVDENSIKLSAPYTGATGTNLSYIIARIFTQYRNLPTVKDSDPNWHEIWNHAIRLIDADIQAMYDAFEAVDTAYTVDIVDITESVAIGLNLGVNVSDTIDITDDTVDTLEVRMGYSMLDTVEITEVTTVTLT